MTGEKGHERYERARLGSGGWGSLGKAGVPLVACMVVASLTLCGCRSTRARLTGQWRTEATPERTPARKAR